MRINCGGLIGKIGDLAFPLETLTAEADALRLDHILVANVDAVSADIGGADTIEPFANVKAMELAKLDQRIAPLYWLRPGRRDFRLDAVVGALQSAAFAGVLLAPGLNEIALTDADVDRVLEIAARLELPVVVRVGDEGAWNAGHVVGLAREHPRVRFVLSGIARHGDVRHASEILRKTQSRGEITVFGDTAACSHEVALELIRLAGAERVLLSLEQSFATKPTPDHGTRLVEHLELNLRKSEYDLVMGRNALQVFSRLRTGLPAGS